MNVRDISVVECLSPMSFIYFEYYVLLLMDETIYAMKIIELISNWYF